MKIDDSFKKTVWSALERSIGLPLDFFRKDPYGDIIRYPDFQQRGSEFSWNIYAWTSDHQPIDCEDSDETCTFKAIHVKNFFKLFPS